MCWATCHTSPGKQIVLFEVCVFCSLLDLQRPLARVCLMLLFFLIIQYCCSKALMGMFLVQLRGSVVPLTTVDSLQSTLDFKPLSPLDVQPLSPLPGLLWTRLSPDYLVAWIDTPACLVWKQRQMTEAVQTAGAAEILILEKLFGSLSERFCSELFQPLWFPHCCFSDARQKEAMPCCLSHCVPWPAAKGQSPAAPVAQERVGHPTQPPPSLPACPCCLCQPTAPGQASQAYTAPRLHFLTSHLLREEEFIITVLGLSWFVVLYFLQNMHQSLEV